MSLVHNPILRLLRQTVSFFIIFTSILIAAFLAIQTREIVLPPSPTIRYNEKLAQLYLKTEDWELIHYIERNIDADELDPNTLKLFETQIWNNYVKSPEEYRFLEYLAVIELALSNRAGDYYTILSNRSTYVRQSDVSLDYQILLTSEQSEMRDLTYSLQLCEDTAKSAREYIEAENKARKELEEEYNKKGKSFDLRASLINYQEFRSLQETIEACNRPALREPIYSFLSPKYRLIVYDGFQRVYNSSLVDIAEDILVDLTEDPFLRLLAADYLSNYGDQDKLIDQLYLLVDQAHNSGSYFQNHLSDTPEEGIFEQEILTILDQAVESQKWRSFWNARK